MKSIKPHIIVGAFIKRLDGKIALFSSPKWPGLWVPPGGHVEYGEKIEDAVRREVFEETGLKVNNLSFIRHGEMLPEEEPTTMPHLIYFHYLCKTKNEDIVLDNMELTDYKWFSPEEILKSSKTDKRVKESIKKLI